MRQRWSWQNSTKPVESLSDASFSIFFLLLKLSGTAGYSSHRGREEKRLSKILDGIIEDVWGILKNINNNKNPVLLTGFLALWNLRGIFVESCLELEFLLQRMMGQGNRRRGCCVGFLLICLLFLSVGKIFNPQEALLTSLRNTSCPDPGFCWNWGLQPLHQDFMEAVQEK